MYGLSSMDNKFKLTSNLNPWGYILTRFVIVNKMYYLIVPDL